MKRYSAKADPAYYTHMEDPEGFYCAYEEALAEIEKARKEGYATGRTEGLNCLSPVTAEARKQGAKEVVKALGAVCLSGHSEAWQAGISYAISVAKGVSGTTPPAPPKLPDELEIPDHCNDPTAYAVNRLIAYLKAREEA